MFHQVAIKKEDQRSQLIFWEGDEPDGEPGVYAVTVMTFGAACSPSSAQFVKNRNADRFAREYPRAVECIKEEHYVDDMLVSVETREEAIQLAETVRYVHSQGGFEIRNWVSNSRTVVEHLEGKSNKEMNVSLSSHLATEKVLGMWWNTASDTFTYRLSPKHDTELLAGKKPATKRAVLRTQMSIYDPMGLLGHFLMYLKVLLQEIWRAGVGWDAPIDGEMEKKWRTWLEVLPGVAEITIPRCYRQLTSIRATVELHVFCDASEQGMAAAAYFRFEENGITECSLVGSKTKVAPIKFVSIPRLELTAAVIGSRLAQTVEKAHRFRIIRKLFWSDSRNVLSWLHSDHRRYHQYVAHRVGELLDATDADQWKWIPTKLNVADDGTKWTSTPDLSPTSRWFRGPSFLWGPENEWPAHELPAKNTTEEIRKYLLHHRPILPFVNFERFSKWKRRLRAVAYVIRFVCNTRHSVHQESVERGPLTQQELEAAEQTILRRMQAEAFPEEIANLKHGEQKKHPWKKLIGKDSPLYKLSPMLDKNGLLRIDGRLSECVGINEDTRQPIILPRPHVGTMLILRDAHESYKHSCHNTVINTLRSRFYIPRLLSEYRRLRAACQRCKIDNAKPEPPRMGNIPYQRVAVGQRAFSYTGIDYFGPLLVSVGRRVEKRWGVIFTCLTTRAVHLEVAHSLTTASCILAIRRFVSKRGTPLEILTDRGTNFIGASRELEEAMREVDQDAVMVEFTTPNMKWVFNPPGAPHFGGCWERLVRSVKRVLEKFNLPRRPTDEILASTLSEIELILNSRPLTYVTVDKDMDGPITPNHLLLGSADGSKPPAPFCDEPTAVKSAWKAAQRNADLFWRKWVAEYLPTLTRRAKWLEPVRPMQEGDLVVIADNNLPRNCWPRGRIAAVVRA